MIPCADIRACRARVSSQSRGERCHSRESTSAATPASGHQQSGEARKTWPANRRGLNTGMGSRACLITARKSPSAAERTPSATSASARRSSADPRRGPVSSSYLRAPIGHFPRWTAPATTARTLPRSASPRAASATARGGKAYLTSPATPTGSGNRVVRRIRTNPASRFWIHAGDEDIDLDRSRPSQAEPPQRGRAGKNAVGPGVKERTHLALVIGRRSGMRQVDPGEQPAPRAFIPEPVPDSLLGQAAAKRLLPSDDTVLPA